ncbi:NADPH-dependent ferric-chelate reductase [Pragia fontium]|uniref:siderophore-interacting protein n=1 Tax=Pragia fontium TaxID=82985 RepID=UPI000DFA3594|nr:siderophore-interacting protein [Pragia fontium]SUB84244.1 NADPH-dependent ferric-chelate reductase [Pragia fontium]
MTENKYQPKYPQRVRNELRFRTLNVLSTEQISTGFQRIIFGGSDLEGFQSQGFDDHIKLFFPKVGSAFTPPEITEEGIVWQDNIQPPSRDYTPIFDQQHHQLIIDFYLHENGVASDWAAQARPGDKLTIGGPRGSLVVPPDYAWQLYVCDESGMPALRRRLEELKNLASPVQVTALINIKDEAYKDYLSHLSGFNLQWVIGDDRKAMTDYLKTLNVPPQDYFIWITGEGKIVSALSQLFENDAIDGQLLRAVAYWHNK